MSWIGYVMSVCGENLMASRVCYGASAFKRARGPELFVGRVGVFLAYVDLARRARSRRS